MVTMTIAILSVQKEQTPLNSLDIWSVITALLLNVVEVMGFFSKNPNLINSDENALRKLAGHANPNRRLLVLERSKICQQ